MNHRILIRTEEMNFWERVQAYAERCSWSGGPISGRRICDTICRDWDEGGRFAVRERNRRILRCPEEGLHRWRSLYAVYRLCIRGRGFQGERVFRSAGQGRGKISERIGFRRPISSATTITCTKSTGYEHVDTKPAYWGEMQKIYRHVF